MNLIQLKEKIETKDRKRNQFIGQKNALIENLKNLGVSSLQEGKTETEKKEKELQKLKIKYQENKQKFLEDFKELLET